MKTLCIIPARGGSKRIPRKNTRPLLGRPLVTWPIATARQAELFDHVMVSTDDDEIAEIAAAAGAAVPFRRSAENADDHATTTAVLREVLEAYQKRGHSFDLVCCLYPTSVLLKAEHLRTAFQLLRQDGTFDSAMAVQAYRHPIERAHRLVDGAVVALDQAKMLVRTQDIEPAYHDAGQFYWFRPEAFRVTGRVLGKRCAPVMLHLWEAVDVDNEADWQFLERLAGGRPLAITGGAA